MREVACIRPVCPVARPKTGARHGMLLLLLLAMLPCSMQAQSRITGSITDATTGAPIPWCTVQDGTHGSGTVCDAHGRFTLSHAAGNCRLRISAIGYETRHVDVTVVADVPLQLRITLEPSVIRFSETVVIEGARGNRLDANDDRWIATAEDAMRRADGVAMIRRGAFAQEVSIRGFGAERVSTVIDGMKVHGACSDRMDPVASYVEVENLDRMEIAKGGFDMTQAAPSSGSVALITRKPVFDAPWTAEAEAGWESAAGTQRLRAGTSGTLADNLALRATASLRRAGDFRAGGGEVLAHSGYAKTNYKADLAWRAGEEHRLTASFIGDDAWDVGFPSTIMDTRRTIALIGSLEHHWSRPLAWLPSLRTLLYANRIDHWMDDNDRDITKRLVMPGMYMPMYGRTRTAGLRSEARYLAGAGTGLVVVEVSHMDAYADMWMHLIDKTGSVQLLTLGDVVDERASIAAEHTQQISDAVSLRGSLRAEGALREVGMERFRRQLDAFHPGLDMRRFLSGVSASLALDVRVAAPLRMGASFAHATRLPSHLESHGFYSYSYTEAAFLVGNPALRSERSLQGELRAEYDDGTSSMRAAVFVNEVGHYIVPLRNADPRGGELRMYANIDGVSLAGGELRAMTRVGTAWEASVSLAHVTWLEQAVPLLPPLTGVVSLGWRGDPFWIGASMRAAARAKHVELYHDLEGRAEDETPGFVVLDLRARWQASRLVEIALGIENLLDHRYHEHLSVQHLPAPGRNIYAGLRVGLPAIGNLSGDSTR
jgi:iron complex outermembrane recepter protein